MYIPSIADIPSQDITYFFRPVVKEQRRLEGVKPKTAAPSSEILPIRRLDDLAGIHHIRLIFGAPVYDGRSQRTKYQMLRVNEYRRDFPRNPASYNLRGISTSPKARMIQEEIIKKLASFKGHKSIEIVNHQEYGYEVRVSMFVDGTQKDLEELDRILFRIGVEILQQKSV